VNDVTGTCTADHGTGGSGNGVSKHHDGVSVL
jgi:hypothetical protein